MDRPNPRTVRGNVFVYLALGLVMAGCSPAQQAPIAQESNLNGCALPPNESPAARSDLNVFNQPLATCSTSPMTGVYRDGRCATGADDVGVHVVCAEVTDAFLSFTKAQGNDLMTPARGFPGLQAGDRWCLCASRWAEAEAKGVAPPVILQATNARAAEIIGRERLDAHAVKAQ
jgi:uncharacterized protein